MRRSVKLPSKMKTLTRAQSRRLFNATSRRYLHMSGSEFVRKWNAGAFPNPDAQPGVMRVAMLLPLLTKQKNGAGQKSR